MLQIRDLVKVYPGPVTALQGIQLDVREGMFGLLGPNGAGKSTLMRIVAGLLEPTSGSVTLDGEDIVTKPERVWEKLGYLPQDFGFYPHLTGEAMLEHLVRLKGVEPRGDMKAYVADLLERVNLAYAAKRKVKQYSGGMRERLDIEQAIAGDPRLIIVDEPTAGLCLFNPLLVYHLPAELSAGRIVLLSTHIVEDVSVLCPRFALIRGGRLIVETTPAEARAPLDGAIYQGSVERNKLPDLREHYHVTLALPFEGQVRVRIWSPSGARPEGFVAAQPTLEDAYLAIIAVGESALGGGARTLAAGAAR
jgi:ABC-type multidrug transport system ATPase subunit